MKEIIDTNKESTYSKNVKKSMWKKECYYSPWTSNNLIKIWMKIKKLNNINLFKIKEKQKCIRILMVVKKLQY